MADCRLEKVPRGWAVPLAGCHCVDSAPNCKFPLALPGILEKLFFLIKGVCCGRHSAVLWTQSRRHSPGHCRAQPSSPPVIRCLVPCGARDVTCWEVLGPHTARPRTCCEGCRPAWGTQWALSSPHRAWPRVSVASTVALIISRWSPQRFKNLKRKWHPVGWVLHPVGFHGDEGQQTWPGAQVQAGTFLKGLCLMAPVS